MADTGSMELCTGVDPEALTSAELSSPCANPEARARIGQVVAGRYRLEEVLGVGGMATVYRAVDQSTGGPVALKQEHSELFQLRFQREYHTLAQLDHPNIVKVFDYGVDTEGAFYTMELLDGADLDSMGQMEPLRVCEMLRDLASLLAFLHARRLLHRDLTARNVRLSESGQATLLDFGILSTFGVAGDIAGTPPYMSPETVHGLPLDARADLFSLGALGYRLLTGGNAYPAKSLAELEARWQQALRPPSAFGEMPVGLDGLIMALLNVDREQRPTSAAYVIHALSVIAGLDAPAATDLPSNYLDSGALVGRKDIMAKLAARTQESAAGRGGALVVEAVSGTGKSRLLKEFGLQAQVNGAAVIPVNAGTGPHGGLRVLREVVREFLVRFPELAMKSVGDHAPVLGHISPELCSRLPNLELAPTLEDAADTRIRLSAALQSWMEEASKQRPLVILVDDVQRADEASLSLFAALGETALRLRLLFVYGLRSDEQPEDAAALNVVRDHAQTIPLSGLGPKAVEELVLGLFGDITGAEEVAQWMHRVAGGSPLHCKEIAHHLVDQGIIEYQDGTWTVHDGFASQPLPKGLAETMDLRVAHLPADAQQLGRALSVLGRIFSVDSCVALLGEDATVVTFDAMNTLIAEEVLIGGGKQFQFRHDGLREAFLRTLGDEERSRLHLRIAEFLKDQESVDLLELGAHWIGGGEELRGADCLSRAGLALLEAASPYEAVRPLMTAIEIYERHGSPPRVVAELRTALLVAGVVTCPQLVRPYIDDTMDLLLRHSGLKAATRISKVIGRRLGVVFAILWTFVLWVLTPKRRKGPSPRASLEMASQVLSVSTGSCASNLDILKARSLVELGSIFGTFSRWLPATALRFSESFLYLMDGRHRLVKEGSLEALSIVDINGHLLSPYMRRLSRTIAAYNVMWAQASDQNPEYEHWRDLGLSNGLEYERITAAVADAVVHRHHARTRDAIQCMRSVDQLKLVLGPQDRHRGPHAWLSTLAYISTRNVVGLRWARKELAILRNKGFYVAHFEDLASAAYHLERRRFAHARELFEAALQSISLDAHQWAAAGIAECLLEEEEYEQARTMAEEALALAQDKDSGLSACRYRCALILARIDVKTDKPQAAMKRLKRAIAEATEWNNPAILAQLHQGASAAALAAGNEEAAQKHLELMHQFVSQTQDPTLGMRLTADTAEYPRLATQPDASDLSLLLADCATLGDRGEVALELLLQESGAAHGYLYLVRDGELVFAAPQGTQPDPNIQSLANADAHNEEGTGKSADSPLTLELTGVWKSEAFFVGKVILIPGSTPLRPMSPERVEEIARALYEDEVSKDHTFLAI